MWGPLLKNSLAAHRSEESTSFSSSSPLGSGVIMDAMPSRLLTFAQALLCVPVAQDWWRSSSTQLLQRWLLLRPVWTPTTFSSWCSFCLFCRLFDVAISAQACSPLYLLMHTRWVLLGADVPSLSLRQAELLLLPLSMDCCSLVYLHCSSWSCWLWSWVKWFECW